MAWDKNKFCACGNPATVKKNFGAVCDRCARIEKSLYNHQPKVNKARSGAAGAVDCYRIHLPTK